MSEQQQQHEKAMTYLQKLIDPNLSANQSRGLKEELLWSAFQCFYHKKTFLSTDERAQAAVYFNQLLPLMENTFADIHGSLNRDKLVEAQMYLSGLKFVTDDFQSEKQLTEQFDKLWQSDPVQCVVDYVENASRSKPEYSDDPKIDLSNVPKSHFWWKLQ